MKNYGLSYFKNKGVFSALFVAIFTLTLSGCFTDLDGDSISAENNVALMTYRGVILSKKKVRVNEGNKGSNMGTGALGGAALGAGAGYLVSGSSGAKSMSSGQIAATGLTALAGAAAGAYVGNKLSAQEGTMYTVELSDKGNQIISFVQTNRDKAFESLLQVGSRVLVTLNPYTGESKIIQAL